jgi:capsular polysaccharide biosynthesis protein
MRRYGFEADRVSLRLAVAAVLVAWGVTWAGLMQQPTYEASAQVLVGERSPAQEMGSGKIQLIPLAPTPEKVEKMSQTMAGAVDSRPVAEEAIYRLGLAMTPAELLDHLTAEQVEGTTFIRISYEDPDPVSAKRIANTVGEVFSALVSGSSAGDSKISATVWEEAAVPESPVSPRPLRNGLLTLIVGLSLAVVLPHGLPRSLAAEAARIADGLVESLRFKRDQVLTKVRQGAAQARALGGRRDALRKAEAIKEQELLEALERCGKLTALRAALETTLTVEEADRMLSDLAHQGHLQVGIEDGRPVYSFWDRDAAP